MSAATAKDPIKVLWLDRLRSALRTTLACTIVIGCTTLYGPAKLRHFLAYPAFSYVTATLIVSDANLGDTLRGCWHALYATIQVIMIPCILTLKLIGPARFTSGLAAVAVAVSAFIVALPESTPLMAKRIAFGQTVIVYVGAVIHGGEAGIIVMLPIHVASSSLAMIFPTYVFCGHCFCFWNCLLQVSDWLLLESSCIFYIWPSCFTVTGIVPVPISSCHGRGLLFVAGACWLLFLAVSQCVSGLSAFN